MFTFCVQEADLSMMAFVAYLAPCFSEKCSMHGGLAGTGPFTPTPPPSPPPPSLEIGWKVPDNGR